MTKRNTARKLSSFYFLFLIICVILFFIILPPALYSWLLERTGAQLQQTAAALVSHPDIYSCSFRECAATERTRDLLETLDEQNGSEIWLVNENGRVMMNSRRDSLVAQTAQIPNFHSFVRDRCYWITGNFYGMFSEKMLSVIAPVTVTPHTTDLVILHFPLSGLFQFREDLTEICLLTLVIFFLASLLLPLAFYFLCYRPMKETLQIANDCATGNWQELSRAPADNEFGTLQSNLAYLARQLQQSGENQRKFIANISHDFRSPLTSIKGYAEAMLDGTVPPASRDRYLEIIRIEAERLSSLTQNILLANSFQEEGGMLEKSVFDINEILQLCAASLEIQCRKKDLHIFTDLSFYPQKVRADKERIQQVVYNLLDNAIKFSYPHSSIHISTAQKNKYVFISVKDHGEGIPPEEIPKIWNRFYKTDTSRNRDKTGTGLGLSIVREILRAHGQNINVISTQGVGSEFIFTLDKAD